MRTTLLGCLVFAASTVLFGVIALTWHDADTWQTPFRILSLPFGAVIGDCLMVALIAGGIGVLFPRTDRTASVVLVVVYSLLALAGVPAILAAPATYVSYVGFFEQLAMVCGAVALYAATEADAAQSAVLGRVARLGLGLCAVSFTLAQIFYLHFTATLVPTWIPPDQTFWAVLTTVAFALAAVAIVVNRQARLATRLMTLMLALFGLLIWVPAVIAHPEAHGDWSEFALNFQITGAAWIVAYLKSF
ncbi:MAG TPA: hypothetical protein VID24_13170 [Candidatus Eremiobacteraceae bacterium]|jgi:hypothetical protein